MLPIVKYFTLTFWSVSVALYLLLY